MEGSWVKVPIANEQVVGPGARGRWAGMTAVGCRGLAARSKV